MRFHLAEQVIYFHMLSLLCLVALMCEGIIYHQVHLLVFDFIVVSVTVSLVLRGYLKYRALRSRLNRLVGEDRGSAANRRHLARRRQSPLLGRGEPRHACS